MCWDAEPHVGEHLECDSLSKKGVIRNACILNMRLFRWFGYMERMAEVNSEQFDEHTGK